MQELSDILECQNHIQRVRDTDCVTVVTIIMNKFVREEQCSA